MVSGSTDDALDILVRICETSDMNAATAPAAPPTPVPLVSARGRWIIAATVLGSGVAFIDSTVVNVALPRIGRDLGGGMTTQQWVLDGYMLTLSALLLLGGVLGDRYGRRRVFVIGLAAFGIASLGCGLAPSAATLIAARLVQGVGGALLVPGSLALIDASIRSEDRSRAIGVWAGLSGVSTAVGPLLGGWMVDAASWRLVFMINLPLAALAGWAALRHVPESRGGSSSGPLDVTGAVAVTVGLGGLTYGLIEIPTRGWTAATVLAASAGAIALLGFPFAERRSPSPLLPLEIFRSRQFSGANASTFAVYGALGGAFFLLAIHLQQSLGYSALDAGLATLPMTAVMLLLSPRMGALADRTGPRAPMTVGPLIAAVGLVMLARVAPGVGYASTILPAVLVFAFGLAITVTPLTSAVLAAVDEAQVGTASGVNNAVARMASLLSVAALPPLAGLAGTGGGALGRGFARAMLISAGLCAVGGIVAWLTVRRGAEVQPNPLPAINHSCQDPCTRAPARAGDAAR
jgi:EmrB/QacA subfamily drug resistance transporter